MTRLILTTLVVLTLVAFETASAQDGRVSVSFSVASVAAESPIATGQRRTAAPAAAVGFAVTSFGAIELGLSWLESETPTSDIILERPNESALYVRTEAVPVFLRYKHSFQISEDAPSPFVAAAAVWARVKDEFEADTPRETRTSQAFGFELLGGVSYKIVPRFELFIQGGYRRLERGDPQPGFDLSGAQYGLGARLHL